MPYTPSEATKQISVVTQKPIFIGYYCDRIGAWHILYDEGVPDARDYDSYPLKVGDNVYFDVQLDPTEPYLDSITVTGPTGSPLTLPRSSTAGDLAIFGPMSLNVDGNWTVTAKDLSISFAVQAVAVQTALTISAPATVAVGQSFTVSGKLTRMDTGAGLSGMFLDILYDGTVLAGVTTDAGGNYSVDVSIPTQGTYTLKASFLGTVGYGGVESATSIGVGVELPPELDLPTIGGVALAIADLVLVGYYALT